MSDGASGENVHDWETAMSYGSMDSDESEDFGDEESVPENWELYSMGRMEGIMCSLQSHLSWCRRFHRGLLSIMSSYSRPRMSSWRTIKENICVDGTYQGQPFGQELAVDYADLDCGMFPCHTNEEGDITMPVRQEYDAHWLRNMEDSETAGAFR
eukprot:scaffold15279_cov37-Attheya_sp.AAC.3